MAGDVRHQKSKGAAESSANLGFEQKLWLAADKLRNNMDAAEYKHVVLGHDPACGSGGMFVQSEKFGVPFEANLFG